MQLIDGRLVYSATDLVGFMECRHLANLERATVEGHLKRPIRVDPVLERIAQRGIQHEERFLAGLAAEGATVRTLDDREAPYLERLARGRSATIEAMRAGVDVIYQATLFDGARLGHADFLRRVEEPSDLGAWRYEVWDTKLARHATAGAVLQISMYSDMVGALQGLQPQRMYLALGGVQRETVPFRVAEYAAYYRLVARQLEEFLAGSPGWPIPTEPAPVEHCEVCAWSPDCRAAWRKADDLSLVAGLTSRQRQALLAAEVPTRTRLAEPPASPVEGVGREAFARIQAQAAIQVLGERAGTTISERLEVARDRDGMLLPNHGLLMLPEPSRGDFFFDIEGYSFFGSDEVDGVEYLFGVVEAGALDEHGAPAFHAFWSVDGGTVTPSAERGAFEAFIDFVMARLAEDPALHVYHYAPYEPTAMKRLAQRHATREEEVDRLLRGQVFVDLYRAVRQGVRASVESYSIERLEPLYGFKRGIEIREASKSIVEFETWLELGDGAERDGLLAAIEAYNRDDCISTLRLRDWLEEQRAGLEADLGETLPRLTVVPEDEREDSDAQKAVQALVDALLTPLPERLEDFDDAGRARWLLAQLQQWHRREEKSFWWRYFFLKDELSDEERREVPDALGQLTFESSWTDPTPRAHSTIYRFRFPQQEHKISVGDTPHDPTGQPAGKVVFIDDDARVIDLSREASRPAPTPTSLIPHDYFRQAPKPESLQRLGQWVLANSIDASGEYRSARDLLLRRPPRIVGDSGPLLHEGEEPQDAARRLVLALDESYIAIQGPPGSGKSSVGAEMIVDLVVAGKRVGVTSTSHKVIGELLDKAAAAAAARRVTVRIAQRGTAEQVTSGARRIEDAGKARDAVLQRDCDVLGATAWQWARDDMRASVDVLFVDEAGQMSLADVLAASLAARNLVLLGDPQQLDQPLQGTHPPGAERSALAHVLGREHVMPADLGLFLDGTWRLHPAIAAYTSEVFYNGRLHSHPGRERLALDAPSPLAGAGLRFVDVTHAGHASDAPEEAAAIAERVQALLDAHATWTDANGVPRPLRQDDVLMIAPYNAQVAALAKALPGFRIGTVDKFQGQEAPVSIYSMATSTAEDAPRGMEFLYSLNRLNVATSRAQCVAILVASRGLLHIRCRTPRQMQLANALARFVELAAT